MNTTCLYCEGTGIITDETKRPPLKDFCAACNGTGEIQPEPQPDEHEEK